MADAVTAANATPETETDLVALFCKNWPIIQSCIACYEAANILSAMNCSDTAVYVLLTSFLVQREHVTNP